MNPNPAEVPVAYVPFWDLLSGVGIHTSKVSELPSDVDGDKEGAASVSSRHSETKRPVSHIEDGDVRVADTARESHNVEQPSADRGSVGGHEEERM
jgi:hypothetical protein